MPYYNWNILATYEPDVSLLLFLKNTSLCVVCHWEWLSREETYLQLRDTEPIKITTRLIWRWRLHATIVLETYTQYSLLP